MVITAKPKRRLIINPKSVAKLFADIEYSPGGPLRVTVRVRDRKYRVWLTRECNIIVPGVNSLIEASRIIKRIYKRLFNDELEFNLEIKNLVVTISVNRRIQLKKEQGKYNRKIKAWVYRKGGKTFLIFETGKIIVTGLRDTSEIKQVIHEIESVLLK